MSSVGQWVTILAFLAYSAIYLMFVSWASDRPAGGSARPRKKAAVFLLGAVLPLVGLLLVLTHL